MSKPRRRPGKEKVTWEGACDLLEGALSGSLRREILDHALRSGDFTEASRRLRASMRSHVFKTGSGRLRLADVVRTLDAATRREGLNVLEEWDQAAHRFSQEYIPVLLLDYFSRMAAPAQRRRRALEILLDFYFLYVLCLLAIRAWDEGDPNANLGRVGALVEALQGGGGSGRRFVGGAPALLFIATSNFQPDDLAYLRLLDRIRTLDERHRLDVALVGGPVLGTHLRWALSAIYERDLVRLREDNAVDYPWLFFSVETLAAAWLRLEEGAEGGQRHRVLGALLNALSADPWAFLGRTPAVLSDLAGAQAELRETLRRHRRELLEELGAHVPSEHAYSPVSLHFNFPHNALVAAVVLSLLAAEEPPNLPFDALLTAPAPGTSGEEVALLARSLTGYAAAHPERRGERRVLIVAYNPPLGLRSVTWTLSALRREGEEGRSGDALAAAGGG